MIMVAGLTALAVGDELVIAHPAERTDLPTNAMLFGGLALFLVAQVRYTGGDRPAGPLAADRPSGPRRGPLSALSHGCAHNCHYDVSRLCERLSYFEAIAVY